jgi:pimeloyl-ACP methyl ester carboxylesterase
MIEFFLKKLIAISISVMTIYVPQARYQDALDSLPDISARARSMNLHGWTFSQVTSSKTGLTHYYYECCSAMAARPVLLCLHGFNTDGAVFFNLKSLSDRYHIIAYNFPEKTSLYKGNIRDFTDILDDFCDVMSIDSLTLMGNSVGGGIALSYAVTTNSTVVQQLVLVSTTVFGATPQNQRQIRGMADKLLTYPDYKLYYLLTKGAAILQNVESPELKNEIPETGVVIKHVDWYKQILKSFYWYDGSKDASLVSCPVLVIHGKKDKLMNAQEIRATKAQLPAASMVLFDDAAHSLVWSHAGSVDSIMRR